MIKLTPEQEAEGKLVFGHLKQKISDSRESYRDHWEWIGKMQELANRGVTEAQKYMESVDLSRAPKSSGYRSSLDLLSDGPPSVAFKGVRRQLHADPTSPNKTFGMRPHGARGEDDDSIEV